MRDYFTGQITEIHHLVQLDRSPNNLQEARWDIYKISFSFELIRIAAFSTTEDTATMNFKGLSPSQILKGSDQRVLFQNSNGCINMGVCFNDPDLEFYDIAWFCHLAAEVNKKVVDEELIFIDKTLKTRSCYVELQRKGYLFCITFLYLVILKTKPTKSSGRN